MREQINGLQSVHRLKTDLRELESLLEQVMPNDYSHVCQQITPIRDKVCSVVQQFLDSNKDLNNPLLGLDSNGGHNSNTEEMIPQMQQFCDQRNGNIQLIDQISETKKTFISWNNLKNELNDLNQIFNTLMTTLMAGIR